MPYTAHSSSVLSIGNFLVLLVLSFTTATDQMKPAITTLPDLQGCVVPAAIITPVVPVAPVLIAADLQVTNAGSSYVINGVTQPTLTVTRGEETIFNLNVAANHPFFIRYTVNGANYPGFTSQGQTSGEQTLLVPLNDPTSQIFYVCGVHGALMSGAINIIDPLPLLVSPKVMLEGPFDAADGMMNDALRADGFVPLTEPYTALGYSYTGSNSGTIVPLVLDGTGNNAIVDWLVIELRSSATPGIVIGSRSGLLQRDGDVVDTDGISPVAFPGMPNDSYYLAVRHRNHLATMTDSPIALGTTTTTVDLTTAATPTFGINARKDVNGTMVLWSGDVNFDGDLKYTGSSNDRDPILFSIGGTVPTNTITGYLSTDLNMDGITGYTGADNDRDLILVNIGGVIPTLVKQQQMP